MKTEMQLNEDLILREHNFATYQQLEGLFERGVQKVGLVQATGTGKSFIALQWLFDNCLMRGDKNILYLTSMQPIIENFKSSMAEVGLDEKAFPNLETEIYAGLMRKGAELSKKYDFIILDEFHRVGAEKWGGAVKTILQANPDAQVLGLSATPIRFLDDGRDMAQELFGDNVVEGMNLCEAVESGVLPKAKYLMGVYSYAEDIKNIEGKISQNRGVQRRQKLLNWIDKARRKIENSDGLEDVFANNIKNKSGKFVGFCIDHEQLREIKEKIESGLFGKVNKDVKIYEIGYTQTAKKVKETISQFESDSSSALKILLSVDMFNEGVHVKGLDGCMMFRPTTSPRIYLQQLGRCLNVGGNQQPVIFDVVNNVNSIRTIGEVLLERGEADENPYQLESFFPFHIDEKNIEISKLLLRIDEVASYYSATTEQYLQCARDYAAEHGDLWMTYKYIDAKTGIHLGQWLGRMKRDFNQNPNKNSEVFEELLRLDEKVFDGVRQRKEEVILSFAKQYFKQNGHLAVSMDFMMTSEDGKQSINFGKEIKNIKLFLKGQISNKYSDNLINALKSIDPRVFDAYYSLETERREREAILLEYAKEYYAKHGHLSVPYDYKIIDKQTGQEFDFGRVFMRVSSFARGSKTSNVFNKSFIAALEKLDPDVFKTEVEKREAKLLRCAELVFKKYGSLRCTKGEIVVDPVTKEEIYIGRDFASIRRGLAGKIKRKDSKEFIAKLVEMDPLFLEYSQDFFKKEREGRILQCARDYFEKHKHLNVPVRYVMDYKEGDVVEKFDFGKELSYVKLFQKGKGTNVYSDEFINALKQIDARVFEYTLENAKREKEEKILRFSKEYYQIHGNLAVPYSCVMEDSQTGEQFKLGGELGCVKRSLVGNFKMKYSNELVEELQKIDARFFEFEYAENLEREKRDASIIRCAESFLKENGHLAIPRTYEMADPLTGETVKLGVEVQAILYYRNHQEKSNRNYTKEVVEKLEELDPRVYEHRYAENLEREQKEALALEMINKFFKENGHLAIPVKDVFVDEKTGRELRPGRILMQVRGFVKGANNGGIIFSEGFVNSIKELDPRVYEENYAKMIAKEGREKRE